RRLRWQRSRQRVARWFPSFRRGRAKEARARAVAPLRYIDVAGCTAPRLARSGTGTDAYAVQTGATNNVARSSEGQPFITGMNAWPRLLGACAGPTWRPAVLHRRKRRRLLSTVAWTAL